MSEQHAREYARLLGNWRAERDSAALYEALARLEQEGRHRVTYAEIAAAERRHAAFWEERLRSAGYAVPAFRPSGRIRALMLLARYFGVGFVVPSVIAREMKERDDYAVQPDASSAGLPSEEHGHVSALRLRDQTAFGNNLRAAVLGANDGLASNFCLMMGVAGASVPTPIVLLTGVAGLLGGACSMALGEWLSVTNARELALSQLDRQTGGAGAAAAHAGVASAGAAVSAAAFSFLLFALGALVPLLPFAILPERARLPGSIAVAALALFLLGVATSLFNARPAWYSGLRQTLFGAAAALVTYLAGHLFGALADMRL